MPISPQIRKNWVNTQRKYDFPVNAIGVKIDPKDAKTMEVWRSENIDEDGRIGNSHANPSIVTSTSKKGKSGNSDAQGLTYRGIPMN